MKKLIAGFIVTLCSLPMGHASAPRAGYVPNKETAVRIAEAVAIPIYGKPLVEARRPFHATLEDGVWHVVWTPPRGMMDAQIGISISKKTGAILGIISF